MPIALRLVPVLLAVCLALPGIVRAVEYPLENPSFMEGLKGWAGGAHGVVEAVRIGDGGAARARMDVAPDKPWTVQLRQPVATRLYLGETIELSGRFRSTGGTDISLALQMVDAPFRTILFKREKTGPEWRTLSFKGKVSEMVPPGGAQLVVTLGYGAGAVEAADLRLSLPDRGSLDEAPAGFAALARDESRLPLVALDAYPWPERGVLPSGPWRSGIGELDKFFLQGKARGEMTLEPVEGQPFARAIRLQTRAETARIYDFQLHQPLVRTLEKDDTVYALFSYRMVEPNPEVGYASLLFALEKIGGRYEKIFQWGVTMHDREWRHALFPVKIPSELSAGAAQMVVRAGFGPQTVEIGDVALISLGREVKPWTLKRTPMEYGGQSGDAAWRQEARERIEKIRKGDFSLRLTDAAGRPLANRRIRLKLAAHDYRFGSTLNDRFLLPGQDRYQPAYGEKASSGLFNTGSLENSMKWPLQVDPANGPVVDAALAWMRDRGWHVRGHVLVWPSWKHSPASLQAFRDKPEALRAAIAERVAATAARYRGRVHDWDVINEPFTNHDFMDILGREAMADWLRIARENAPDARLFINDFDLLTRPGTGNPKIAYYDELLPFLRSKDAPLDGFGFQAHFLGILTPLDHVKTMIDRFAAGNLGIQITELTVNIPDEEAQARYARDILMLAFSHPSVDLVQTWGFWEGRMFEPEAAMYRHDWTPKPLLKALSSLFNETFTTDITAVTDADGRVAFRGFYGSYALSPVDRPEEARTVRLPPANAGRPVEVVW